MSRRRIRVQLTAWYVAAMVVTLVAYVGVVFVVVSRSASLALDESLRGDFQWASEMAEQQPDGSLTWFQSASDSPWLQVWSPEGHVLFQTAYAGIHPIPEARALAAEASGRIVSVPGSPVYRLLSGAARVDARPIVIQVARSEEMMLRERREVTAILLLGLPLAVLMAGLGGYILARRALAPVERMAERVRAITADHLDERLPVDHADDELGRLSIVVNATLGRLEASFDQMRQFTADVSHELRTPLAAMRSVGEAGLRDPLSTGDDQAVIGSMLEEADRLACLIDRLLMWSRAETGQTRLMVQLVDLTALAREVAAHLGVLAEEKQQTLTIECPERAPCRADRDVLRQALVNLVDNAIKFTPPGGAIRLRVGVSGGSAWIDVADSGPGIAADVRDRVFHRFHRTHASGGGLGLGLAIAKWAIEVNGGQLHLCEENGRGTTFRLTMPLASEGRLTAA